MRRAADALRRVAAALRRCHHDGPMIHVRTLGPGVELWRCTLCDAEVAVSE